jgi:hypothetical protein
LIARIRYHSAAFLSQIQRDEAYKALRKSQQELMEANFALQRLTNVDGLTGCRTGAISMNMSRPNGVRRSACMNLSRC